MVSWQRHGLGWVGCGRVLLGGIISLPLLYVWDTWSLYLQLLVFVSFIVFVSGVLKSIYNVTKFF